MAERRVSKVKNKVVKTSVITKNKVIKESSKVKDKAIKESLNNKVIKKSVHHKAMKENTLKKVIQESVKNKVVKESIRNEVTEEIIKIKVTKESIKNKVTKERNNNNLIEEFEGDEVDSIDDVEGEVATDDLPTGWRREWHVRTGGTRAGRRERRLVTEEGRVLRSQKEVDRWQEGRGGAKVYLKPLAEHKESAKHRILVKGSRMARRVRRVRSRVRSSTSCKVWRVVGGDRSRTSINLWRVIRGEESTAAPEVARVKTVSKGTRSGAAPEPASVARIDAHLAAAGLPVRTEGVTAGDGNCWYRALAAQVRLAGLRAPVEHGQLRRAVAAHVKLLPAPTREHLATALFQGQSRALANLAWRQQRDGEYVDMDGVMGIATAALLGRNIEVFTFASAPYLVEAVGAGALPALPVFLHAEHYQALRRL